MVNTICNNNVHVNSAPDDSPLQIFFCSEAFSPFQLFCTERARKALQSMQAPAVFREVLHSRTEAPVGDLYFVEIQPELPPDAVDLRCAREVYPCPCCGKKTYCPPLLPLQVDRSALLQQSILCKTAEIFSYGGNLAFPITLISHELYQTLKEGKLDRGLHFRPVILFWGT